MSNDANMHGHAEVITHHEVHHDEHHVHHHKETFITKYIFSQDHKTIGKQFLITGIAWAIIGGLFSVLFRLQLGFPDQTFPILETFFGKWAKGGQIQPEFYYALITMHGTVLVFFVLTAGLSGTFANLLIPLQCGARDMASPFLNMLSYWFFFMASVVMVSSLLGGLNYISTILNMRTKGMRMTRLPLTIWALFFTAILGVLSFPVLLSGFVLLIFDRHAGTSFYLS